MATANTKRNVSKDYSDLFNTPTLALEALFNHEEFAFDKELSYFEPCNGKGAVSNFIKEHTGVQMVTNELFGYSKTDFTENYLSPKKKVANEWDYDMIISNPPFKIGAEFVQEGFKYAKEQYQLLRLNFLEGKSRSETLFSKKHLKRVFIFSYRVSCTKGMEEEDTANAVAYAWYHFDREYSGSPEILWIT